MADLRASQAQYPTAIELYKRAMEYDDAPAIHLPLAVAYGESAVWVACGDETVVRVDPATNRASKVASVGRLPRGIAADEGGVWVTLN